MLRITVVFGILLTLVLALASCGGSETAAPEEASSTSTGVTLNEDYADALPVSSQLAIGTLMLEDTDDAVTSEQAGELLPAWQMLSALQASGTAADAEIEAVLKQIQAAMTAEQLTAIQEMQLTPTSMLEMARERGLGTGRDMTDAAGPEGGVTPPAGMVPGAGGGPGGGFGMDMGGATDLNPEEQEAAMAERMNASAGTAMTDMVVSLLEARAAGESWEMASPNQGFGNMGVMLGVVAEATGLDQSELVTQAGAGKTLTEIATANGADVDEIVAQTVAAETERINQAVDDGSLEQADADDMLASLEGRVKESLEQPLQFGGGVVSDNAPDQP
jgi:hypothetical protein